MEGYGLLIGIAILMLFIAIFMNTCKSPLEESFVSFKLPKAGPEQTRLPTNKEPSGYTSLADLPSAPIDGLAETNSLPYQNPELEKSSFSQLKSLKQDMDGFAAFELPQLENRSDPAIQLPATRFKGDYQRVKDELLVISRNPSLQPQLTINDINDMAANLRFLQRTYRLYANSQLVPPPKTELSKVNLEGFTSTSDSTTPITPDEIAILSQKLAVEIARLQATGTTDPILQARVGIFSNMRQAVNDIQTKLKNGTMAAKDIPIMKSDYANFLPALGNTSAGIGGLISKSGNESISSLFNSYDKGDVEGSEVSAALFEKYADDLIKGTTFSVSYKYTGTNEVEREKARAEQSLMKYALTNSMNEGGLLHPGVTKGSRGASSNLGRGGQLETSSSLGRGGQLETSSSLGRGEFEDITSSLDLANFEELNETHSGIRPPAKAATPIGNFDWKERAESITQNIKKAGLNPSDYGCLPAGAQVSSDYSWRGHTKMICTRLEAAGLEGAAEQMGCPPVSWKGWRL
jgi:hypothetical protein